MSATVLIVDDEKDLVELVRYHLEKDGLTCLEARPSKKRYFEHYKRKNV